MKMSFGRTRSKVKLLFTFLAVFISISFLYVNTCLNQEPDVSTIVELFSYRTSRPRIFPINYTLSELKKGVLEWNSVPQIRNKQFLSHDFYDNSLSNQSALVILVQVHSRINYLKELIMSLRNTKHIERSLLIFSHDLFLSEINQLIEKIDFCAVIVVLKFVFERFCLFSEFFFSI